MHVFTLFRSWGKKANKPISYRPQFLTLENRETPGGLLSGASAGNFLDLNLPALDDPGLTRTEPHVHASPWAETNSVSGITGDAGQDTPDTNTRPHWSSNRETVSSQSDLAGKMLLLPPSDLKAQQPNLEYLIVDLSWHYMSNSARQFGIFRSCDGADLVRLSTVDYPTMAYRDMTVQHGQVCKYGVRAENGQSGSLIAYSEEIHIV